MRCHYMSDLHLEAQAFEAGLPAGDVLILAGDLCHARCLDPIRQDKYSADQRARMMRFMETARENFAHVLLVAGNHEHYDGVYEDTIELLRRHLDGITVLDDEAVEIDGVRFFGTTLWTNFEGGCAETLDRVRRKMGEYFFVQMKVDPRQSAPPGPKFRPEDALHAHTKAWAALQRDVAKASGKPVVIVSHHAPSYQGLNRRFAGDVLDCAYASKLDETIEGFENVPVWIHGHTHISGAYRIGRTMVRTNALGFAAKGLAAPGFSVKASFEV